MNENSQLGVIGESFFKHWCSKAGLVTNKANEDQTGWDYFVEFPIETDESKPLDMHPTPVECKIQVKSVKATSHRKKKIDITVSNLNRLIRTQMPVFICIIEYDENHQEQTAYLIHIWEDIIGRTLKRIRKSHINGTSDKLNTKTITIDYEKCEQINVTDGNSLRHAIKSFIPNGVEHYLKKKNEFLNKLGFENGGMKINFNIIGEDNFKDFIDMGLGFNKKVKVDKIVGFDLRFGILSKNTSFDIEAAEMHFPEIMPNSLAIVKFKESKFSPGVSFETPLYISNLNMVVPNEYRKIRFKGIFFDIVITPFNNDIKCDFSLDFEKRFELKQLRDILYAFKLLSNSNNEKIIEFKIENHPPITDRINTTPGSFPDFSNIYDISNQLLLICQKLRVPDNEISMSIPELGRCLNNIKTFHSIVFGDAKKFLFKFNIDSDVCNEKTKIAFLQEFQLEIGNKIIGCIIGYIGTPNIINQDEYKYELIPEESLIGPTLMVQEGEQMDDIEIDRIYEEFAEQFFNKGIITISNRKAKGDRPK
jgi:hypothetical protein